MENLPTLRQMQYLLALHAHRNFHAAAKSCNVTQSTLSGGIRDMEDILGAPAIDRTNRRIVRFTPLGKDIIKAARPIIEQMEKLVFRARENDAPLSWPIRMGVIPTIAPYVLPRILKDLQTKLPQMELHIHELRSQQLVEKLHDGELDFGLMAFPYDTGGLAQKTVLEEEFHCVAPQGYFNAAGKLKLKDLESEKLLLLEDGHCMRGHALDACKLTPVSEMKTLSAASLSTLIRMVHTGYGITLLPAMAVNGNPMLPKDIDIRRFASPPPKRKIGFAWKHKALRESDIALVTKEMGALVSKNFIKAPS